VEVGTTGLLIYQPVLLALTRGQAASSCSESTGDIYNMGIDPALTVRAMAEANSLSQEHRLAWSRFK